VGDRFTGIISTGIIRHGSDDEGRHCNRSIVAENFKRTIQNQRYGIWYAGRGCKLQPINLQKTGLSTEAKGMYSAIAVKAPKITWI
jgi:hypothetical protein